MSNLMEKVDGRFTGETAMVDKLMEKLFLFSQDISKKEDTYFYLQG